MPRRDEVTRKGAIERLQKLAEEPDYVIVRTTLLVHERQTHGRACRCCGSTVAEIVDEVPDLELLIDTTEGRRYLRHEMFRRGTSPLRDHGRGRDRPRGLAPVH